MSGDGRAPSPNDIAEWAIRWEAADNVKLEGVCRTLDLEIQIKEFEVRYFRVIQPFPPAAYRWILRSRMEMATGEVQTTIKLRGPAPIEGWEPPVEDPDERSEEWDLSVGPEGPLPPVYSHSVTSHGDVTPVDWTTEKWGAPAAMRRVRDKHMGATVEEWVVGNRRYLEISRRGRADDGEAFGAWVAAALGDAVPLADGMTQLVTAQQAVL